MTKTENKIRQIVEEGEYPFLYMYQNLIEENRLDFIDAIMASGREHGVNLYKLFMNYLEKSPVHYSFYFINELYKRIGSNETTFNRHRNIDEILGETLSQNQRKELWQRFRRICQMLHLSVSPITSGPNYIVNEYIRQVGIPENYIKDLTKKLITFTNSAGLPISDDLESVKFWKINFCNKYYRNGLQDFIIEILKNDDFDFYINSFIKLYNDKNAEIKFKYEEKMLEILNEEFPRTSKISRFPHIILENETLGILLPGDRDWHIYDVYCENKSLLNNKKYSLFEDKFIYFDDIIYSLSIKDNYDNVFNFKVWEEKANQVLFFDSKGTLKKSTSLGEKIELSPGSYTVLARERLHDDWLYIDDFLEIYLGNINFDAGEQYKLESRNGKLEISTKDSPQLLFNQQPYRDANNQYFYPSHKLDLLAYIPNFVYDDISDIGIRINDKNVNTAINYEKGFLKFNLDSFLEGYKKGLYRFKFEIFYKNKLQIRKTELIWNGLEKIEEAEFIYDKKPDNISDKTSKNIVVNENKITIKDNLAHKMYLNFMNGEKIIQIVWKKPGISVSLSQSKNDFLEIPIKIGSQVAVSNFSRDQLVIYSDKDIEIFGKNFSKILSFKRVQKHILQLSSLIEYAKEDRCLYYKEEGDVNKYTLINIISLHFVKHFKCEVSKQLYTVKIELGDDPEKILLKFNNLLVADSYYEISLNLYEGVKDYYLFEGVGIKIFKDKNKLEILFNNKNWNDGWWFLDFEFFIQGKWGRPTNDRENFFSTLIVTKDNEFYQKGLTSFSEIKDSHELLEIFEEIHRVLQKCYSVESWEFVGWLKDVWYNLLKPLSKKKDTKIIAKLLKISLDKQTQDTPESWISITNIGASRPKVYSWESSLYSDFNLKNTWQEKSILMLKSSQHIYDKIKSGEYVHIASMFDNFNRFATNQDTVLKNFNRNNFTQSIKETKSSGILSLVHYKEALIELKDNYEKTLIGYDSTRPRALGIAKNTALVSKLDEIAYNLPPKLMDILEINFNDEQEGENLHIFSKFISLYAMYCRLECRKKGILKHCLVENGNGDPIGFSKIMSYIFGIGESLFFYFLLFWELIFVIDENMVELSDGQ